MTELDTFLDALDAKLARHIAAGCEMLETADMRAMLCEARLIAQNDAPTDHWSPWLEWRGGPCPLPGGTLVEIECHDKNYGSATDKAGTWNWSLPDDWPGVIRRFRYRADNPAGWLPRGDWMPPAELWSPECPVRCEWRIVGGNPRGQDWMPAVWDDVRHIRLVAREPQAGLPEAQPEPGAVPELPEYVTVEDKTAVISLQCGREVIIGNYYTPDDLDRIAAVCTKLAARERVRRAGS